MNENQYQSYIGRGGNVSTRASVPKLSGSADQQQWWQEMAVGGSRRERMVLCQQIKLHTWRAEALQLETLLNYLRLGRIIGTGGRTLYHNQDIKCIFYFSLILVSNGTKLFLMHILHCLCVHVAEWQKIKIWQCSW